MSRKFLALVASAGLVACSGGMAPSGGRGEDWEGGGQGGDWDGDGGGDQGGEGDGDFDPDDEVSGIEGGNATPTDDQTAQLDGGEDGPSGAETKRYALMVATGEGRLTLRAAPAADPVLLLPDDVRLDMGAFRPVTGGDVALIGVRGGAWVIDGRGEPLVQWSHAGCAGWLSPPVHLPALGLFAFTEDRSGCGEDGLLHLLGADEGALRIGVPRDLRVVGSTADGQALLYSRRSAAGRLVLQSGDLKPAYRAELGERVRAVAVTHGVDDLRILTERADGSRILSTDAFGLASSVDHDLDPLPTLGAVRLTALADGALALAQDEQVLFFDRPKADPVRKEAGAGGLLAVSVLPGRQRILATWDGTSAVLGHGPFESMAFEHQPGSVPTLRPDGQVIALDSPGDGDCSDGVTLLDRDSPDERVVVSTGRCDRAVGWLSP